MIFIIFLFPIRDQDMSTQKEYVPVAKRWIYRLLHPKLVTLIVSKDRNGKVNVMTAAWSMPVSISPPLIVVSISSKRFTYDLIIRTKEFVVCIPPSDMVNEVHYFGTVSGRTTDKISKSRVSLKSLKSISTPFIDGSLSVLGCKLVNIVDAGDHKLIIGEVVEAYTKEEYFKKGYYDVTKTPLLYHIGGPRYTTLSGKILKPKRV